MNQTQTPTIPIPDLDNDEIGYRFSKHGDSRGYRTVYNIERSINGGKHVTIGTVVKTSDADWSHSASWVATAKGGAPSAQGSTRTDAVSSLENRLQPAEYHDRKRAEHVAEEAARRQAKEDETTAMLARIDAVAARVTSPIAADALTKIRGQETGEARYAYFANEKVLALIEELTTTMNSEV